MGSVPHCWHYIRLKLDRNFALYSYICRCAMCKSRLWSNCFGSGKAFTEHILSTDLNAKGFFGDGGDMAASSSGNNNNDVPNLIHLLTLTRRMYGHNYAFKPIRNLVNSTWQCCALVEIMLIFKRMSARAFSRSLSLARHHHRRIVHQILIGNKQTTCIASRIRDLHWSGKIKLNLCSFAVCHFYYNLIDRRMSGGWQWMVWVRRQ